MNMDCIGATKPNRETPLRPTATADDPGTTPASPIPPATANHAAPHPNGQSARTSPLIPIT